MGNSHKKSKSNINNTHLQTPLPRYALKHRRDATLQQLCIYHIINNPEPFSSKFTNHILSLIWAEAKSLLLHSSHANLEDPLLAGYLFSEDHSDEATDAALLTIANTHSYLLSLSFSHCNFSSIALLALAEKSGAHLTSLTLHMCERLKDAEIAPIFKHLPNLEEIEISRPGLETVAALADNCPNLRVPNFNWTFETLRLLSGFIDKLPLLEYLHFQILSPFDDSDLAEVAKCHNLKTLVVSCCSQRISQEGVIQMARGCRALRKLEISSSGKLTDEALREIAENCTLLKELSISGYDITDEGMRHLAKCTDLEFIRLSNSHVTSAWVDDFMELKTRKFSLAVTYCNYMSDLYEKENKYFKFKCIDGNVPITFNCKKCERAAEDAILW